MENHGATLINLHQNNRENYEIMKISIQSGAAFEAVPE
jgi:hypothetical protein